MQADALPVEAAPGAGAGAGGEAARNAGRGGLAIAGAKVSFILFGFAQQLLLPALLRVDGYGEVSRVLAIVAIVNNVVVAAAIQGVSHAVSSAPEGRSAEAFRRALHVHLTLAVALSLGFALAAGRIASAVGAPQVAAPLRLAAAVILLYGAYAPLVGSLNGTRRFTTQAGLDVTFGLLRTAGLAGGALLFLKLGESGVVGAIAGFVAAATLILPIALRRAGTGRAALGARDGAPLRAYLRFLVPLALGQVFLNLLLQTDFMLVSRFAGQAAEARGLLPKAADTLVGVYRGVQLFAFLPYQMLMSITFILFPMLARAKAEGDGTAVRDYVRAGVRLSLLTAGLMSAIIAGLAPHVLRFAFPEEIGSQGGDALRVLSLGMGSLSVLGITCSALTSLGRARRAAVLTAGTVAAVAAGCAATVPAAGFGPAMLVQAAIATSIALTAAAIVAAVELRRVAGAFVSPWTLARVPVALGLALAAGSRLPWPGKLLVPVEAAAVAAVYVGALVLLRELGQPDLARLKQVFGARRAAR